jgi:hypothetical protein
MGMYTELVFKGILKNPPEEMVKFLNGRCEGDTQCKKWEAIINTDTLLLEKYGTNRLFVFLRTDIKNYNEEIEEFLEWIKPYLEMERGSCIGWYWYEEDSEPTLLYI